ncbi:MAG: M1 family metallopeptidase [Gemmatimonadota bacterium]|nr:MAG: M1 family metallopeptidase [Gemmatimonadota bacterium]
MASYQIDVTLDNEKKKLYGDELITFTNISETSLDTLYLHLYPNAFRDEKTTFMRECPKWFRRRVARRRKWGYMDIGNVEIAGGVGLNDSIIINETVMKVVLPQLVPPGEEVELCVEFTVQLPEVIARMGYKGDHYSIGQWFPKMCAIRPDGSWVNHQYHCSSEFFANFGTYDVSFAVPEEYVVGATGYLQDETVDDEGMKTVRYNAETVHDFYWEADPDFTVTREVFDGVEVSFLCRPAHKRKIPRVMETARMALNYLGEWYGSYPYKKLVITDAETGPGGGGMEYPMIVAVEFSWLLPKSIRFEEAVLIHEIGHQWWYGVVASNEFEEAWLDEGINTYSTRKVLETLYGERDNFIKLFGLTLREPQYERGTYLMKPKSDPIVKDSWEFENFLSYTATVYSKASFMLETLERYVGEDVMREILRTYYQRFSFRHPTTDDFIAIAEEVSAQGLDWFFEPLLYGTGVCDYAVTWIESRETYGVDKGSTPERYRTKVKVERLGAVVMPVGVLIELEDGESINKNWDGMDRWVEFEMETGSKIKSAVVDPESKIVLDVDMNNNGMTVASQDLALFKIGSRLLFLWETAIQCLTGL